MNNEVEVTYPEHYHQSIKVRILGQTPEIAQAKAKEFATRLKEALPDTTVFPVEYRGFDDGARRHQCEVSVLQEPDMVALRGVLSKLTR